MSLYREPGRTARRTLAVVGLVAVFVGAIAGFAVGRSTAPDPTLREKIGDLRSRLQPLRQAVELVATEYPQAVRGGRVVAPTEYSAARQDIARARDSLSGARSDLRALNAQRAADLERSVAALAAAVDRRDAPPEVIRLSRAADAAVVAVVGD